MAGTSAILVLIAALGVLDAEQNAQGAPVTLQVRLLVCQAWPSE